MSKHTPGPWKLRWIGAGGWTLTAPAVNPLWTEHFRDSRFRKEDAHLISSAPELLAALQALLAEEFRDDDDPILRSARIQAERAIAKATGANDA